MKLAIHSQTVAVLGVLVIIIGCSNKDVIVNAIRLKNDHLVSVLASTTARNDNVLLLLKISRGGGGSGSTTSSNISVISDITFPSGLSGGDKETSVVRDSIATTSNSVSSLSSSLSPIQSSSSSSSPSEDLAMKSAKWNGLRIRALSTIGIISSLIGLSYFFREDGLSVFVVVLQVMMYREMTRTVGGSGDDWGSSVLTKIRKYWWLAIAVVTFNGPKLYPWKRTMLEAITFTMTISIGLITSILDFQYNKRSNNGSTIEFREYIQQTAVSLLSAVLVVLPSSYWIGTLEEYGMKWIFFPATFVAINDIMAYVFGKLFGKHPLLSSISPNKTWEGFIGAAIATAGTAWVTLAQQQSLSLLSTSSPLIGPGLTGVTRFDGMVVAIFSSLIAPFAGFLASVIKRAYGRKDFGTLLPGHGGVVDRLDCQLILAPFVYFYLSLFKFAAATTTTASS